MLQRCRTLCSERRRGRNLVVALALVVIIACLSVGRSSQGWPFLRSPSIAKCMAREDDMRLRSGRYYAGNLTENAATIRPEFEKLFPCDSRFLRVTPPDPRPSAGATASPSCGTLIATGFFDIGRSSWGSFQRPSDEYIARLGTVLSLQNPMAVYVGYELVDFVVAKRREHGLMDRTFVVGMPLECLPASHLAQTTIDLMCAAQEARFHAGQPHTVMEYVWGDSTEPEYKILTPERTSPWYNLLMWSKTEFLRGATMLPWPKPEPWLGGSSTVEPYAVWLDGGCHAPMCGKEIAGTCFTSKARPAVLPEKLRVCQLQVFTKREQQMSPQEFSESRTIRFAGTMFGTGLQYVPKVADAFRDTLRWLLVQGVVDQDQTVLAYMYVRNPDSFDAYLSDAMWYGVGRLF